MNRARGRTLHVACRDRYFVLLALLCVAATAMLRLYLPNFQGEIFDRVIDGTSSENRARTLLPVRPVCPRGVRLTLRTLQAPNRAITMTC
jgi:hypothetical protein